MHRSCTIGAAKTPLPSSHAYILRSRLVTSVEVDPVVAEAARVALLAGGYTPTLFVGDGAAGHPGNDVVVRPGPAGRPQVLIPTSPDEDPREDEPRTGHDS